MIVVLDVFSQLSFWFLVIMSGYWFIFFKLEENVYVLLPSLTNYTTNNYIAFNVIFGILFGFKFLLMIYKIIFEQCSFDIFLIDWEKPKENGINAWRQLLLLNEFNELQTEQLISMEFTLICYAFFMEGVGWRYLSSYDPNLTTTANKSPENYVLNFFVTAIVIYAIGIV
jgi:meckelin